MHHYLFSIILNVTSAILSCNQATIIFAGDAMMHQGQIDAAKVAPGKYDYSECFTMLEPMISHADYAVVNLETPLGTSNYTGYPCFNAPVSYAEALADAGFDLFLTANNHTLDRHDRGLRHTIAALDSLKLDHIGTYLNNDERRSHIPFIKNINGFKVGFLNYTYGTNGIEVQGDVVVDYINRTKMADDIAATRNAGAEIVVVAVHWGNEYQLSAAPSQKSLADFLFESGADAVIGGHPHVVQPYELRINRKTGKKEALTYSLGNFISNMRTRDTRGGALATLKLERDSVGNAVITDLHYDLVYTVPPGAGSKQFKVVPIDSVPTDWHSRAQAFRQALH